MLYNGYTNHSTYMVDLYFSNGSSNDGITHVNKLLSIKCFKNIDGFKQFVLSCLKTDDAWKLETNSKEYINECNWQDLFEQYADDIMLVSSTKELLKQFEASGEVINLPSFKLDRELYLEVKAIIESYGYKYVAGAKKRFEKKDANAVEDLKNMINGVSIVDAQKKYDFYPTPEKIVNMAQKWLNHDGIGRILEPSCGLGNLVSGLENFVDAIELNPDCINELNNKNIKVIHDDFDTFESTMKYDYIIMNPPFSKYRDAKHILKAYDMLNVGGTLIAVASGGLMTRNDKISKQVTSLINDSFKFSDKEFKNVGTNIDTILIKIIK